MGQSARAKQGGVLFKIAVEIAVEIPRPAKADVTRVQLAAFYSDEIAVFHYDGHVAIYAEDRLVGCADPNVNHSAFGKDDGLVG